MYSITITQLFKSRIVFWIITQKHIPLLHRHLKENLAVFYFMLIEIIGFLNIYI